MVLLCFSSTRFILVLCLWELESPESNELLGKNLSQTRVSEVLKGTPGNESQDLLNKG